MTWTNTKQSVLVPFDFSNACQEALKVARGFVAHPQQITALHVIAPLPPIATFANEQIRQFDRLSDQALEKMQSITQELGLSSVQSQVHRGSPVETIVEFAEAHSQELIVIPSHGRTGIHRWLLGSVAERVVRFSPCPVLVLRAGEAPDTKSE